MNRTLVAVLFAAGSFSPALAQQAQQACTMEATQIRAAVEQSTLPQDQKAQVDEHLSAAIQQEEAGDSAACAATLDQVKLALGIQQPAPTQTP